MPAPLTAETPPLVPQPHGGALYRGGVKGNRGNRLRKELTSAALHMVADRMPVLGSIADGVVVEWTEVDGVRVPMLASPTPGERTKAMALLWDIANSAKKVNMGEVRKRLTQQVEVIRRTLPREQADALLQALAEVWK